MTTSTFHGTTGRLVGIAGAALLGSAMVHGGAMIAAGDAQAAETPKRGGSVVIGLNRPIRGFDHIKVPRGGMARQQPIFAVHERLFDVDHATGKLIPQLGMSTSHNADFTLWRVKLREGAKFSNGKEVTAKAYEWHFKRLFAGPLAGTFKGEMGAAIGKVVAADKYTIEFRFLKPAPHFEVILADNLYIWTLSEPKWAAAHHKDKDFNLKAVGAGPYMIKEYIPRKKVVLVRNPHYYAPKRQYLDQITFIPHPGREAVRIRAVKAGDYAGIATRGTGFVFAKAQKDLDLLVGSRTSTAPSINFHMGKAPFNDLRVRQALNLSLDRVAMAKILSKNWPPAMMGNSMFARSSRWYCKDVQYPKQDLAKARKLMKEYGKPVKAVVLTGGLTTFIKYGEMVQHFAAKVGIELEIKNIGRGTAAIVGPINRGEAKAWIYSYGNVADPLQVQTQLQSKHAANVWRLRSPKVDAAIDKLKKATGFKARYAANCDLQRVLHAELPFLYGLESRNGIIKAKWLKGLKAPRTTLYGWHRAWVNK